MNESDEPLPLDEWAARALREIERIIEGLESAPTRQVTPASRRLIVAATERLHALIESGQAAVGPAMPPAALKLFRRSFRDQMDANGSAKGVLDRLSREINDKWDVGWIDSELTMGSGDGTSVPSVLRETWTFSFVARDHSGKVDEGPPQGENG